MRIGIVTPAPLDCQRGNVVTARRWEAILRELGHRPRLLEVPEDPAQDAPLPPLDDDALIALHARRSAPAALAFREAHPQAPLIVALTGTDLYADLPGSLPAQRALEAATRIVVLQERALRALPPAYRDKGRVVHQGVTLGNLERRAPPSRGLQALVLAHLRPVKAPLLAAQAARLVSPELQLEVVLLGEALDESLAAEAREEQRDNPRFTWLGDVPRREALARLAGAHVLLSTSRLEGGANAVGEALALGVPVIATRVEGALGLLGDDYPGLVPVDDAPALAAMLERFERDLAWRAELTRRCRTRGALVEPAHELAAWRALLAELAP